MPITPQNILHHELIGLKAKIVKSSDRNLVNMTGIIIDETKKTFVILSNQGEKRIAKQIVELHIVLPNGNIIEVNGRKLLGQPENRVKKKNRRKW
ncbi:MAG: ribonuclease P protein component 1 [Candidatus Hodarchaeota archaeon]